MSACDVPRGLANDMLDFIYTLKSKRCSVTHSTLVCITLSQSYPVQCQGIPESKIANCKSSSIFYVLQFFQLFYLFKLKCADSCLQF